MFISSLVRIAFKIAITALIISFATVDSFANDDWTQWGGSARDFRIDSALPSSVNFEESWRRQLGGGYSAILVDSGRLYTMYRKDGSEFVICMNSETGETVWEESYTSDLPEEADTSFGEGPNSTPLIAGDRLITIGFLGDMNCFDKTTGERLWQTNLVVEQQGTEVQFGYSASPILYEDKIVLPIGGDNNAIKAFNVADGSVAWSNQGFNNSYSTPKLVSVDGLDQMIFVMTDEVISVDPRNGELFWQFPLKNQWSTHAFVPVWDESKQILFVASFRQSHGLKMTRQGDRIEFEKVWSNEKTGIGFTNAVLVDGVVYGTTGGTRSPLASAINISDGNVLWRERGLGVANFLAVGNKLIILDETGKLFTASPDANGLNKSEASEVLSAPKAWTVPSLVERNLFVRDQAEIVALTIAPID